MTTPTAVALATQVARASPTTRRPPTRSADQNRRSARGLANCRARSRSRHGHSGRNSPHSGRDLRKVSCDHVRARCDEGVMRAGAMQLCRLRACWAGEGTEEARGGGRLCLGTAASGRQARSSTRQKRWQGDTRHTIHRVGARVRMMVRVRCRHGAPLTLRPWLVWTDANRPRLLRPQPGDEVRNRSSARDIRSCCAASGGLNRPEDAEPGW